jgi:hypothetical protein
MLDVLVAHVAANQGLAKAPCHRNGPCRLWPAARALKILQGANMVDFDVLLRTAKLATIRQESLFKF